MKRMDVILQARSRSTRLPGKIYKKIRNRPMLEWIIDRLSRVQGTRLCVATTRFDFAGVKKIADQYGALTLWGSENDVLSRYLKAARSLDSDIIVRTTADNPIVDYESINRALKIFEDRECDHLVCDGLPFGAGFEVISRDALEKAARLAGEDEREHVTTHILRNPLLYRMERFMAAREVNCPGLRVTVDTPDDLEYIRGLFEKYYIPDLGTVDLWEVVKNECP